VNREEGLITLSWLGALGSFDRNKIKANCPGSGGMLCLYPVFRREQMVCEIGEKDNTEELAGFVSPYP